MSQCRECGARIAWEDLPSGKVRPVNPETGEVHFASCPKRHEKVYPDDVCIECGSLSVQRGPGTGPHFASLRCLEPECRAFRWLKKPAEQPVTP